MTSQLVSKTKAFTIANLNKIILCLNAISLFKYLAISLSLFLQLGFTCSLFKKTFSNDFQRPVQRLCIRDHLSAAVARPLLRRLQHVRLGGGLPRRPHSQAFM